MDAVLAAGVAATGTVALGATAHGFWRRNLGAPPRGLPAVLAYHKVGTPELGGTWCTRRQFAAHLEALRRSGYGVIDTRTFAQLLSALPEHSANGASSRAVLLTFDDAYASFADHALPELEAQRFPSLLFVISEFVGKRAHWDLALPGRRRPHLDWSALRDLLAQGVQIGSHAATHRNLCRLPDAELRHELEGSRRRLEDGLGVEVRSLSYPFGRCDARVVAAAVAAGYQLGFSMCPPGPNSRVQPLALRRFGVYIIDSPRAVLDKVDPRRSFFWFQDLLTRGINACAAWPARTAAGGQASGRERNEG